MITISDNCTPPRSLSEKPHPSLKARDVKGPVKILLKDFQESGGTIFLSAADSLEHDLKDLIAEVSIKNGEAFIESGNYLGKFTYGGIEFNIKSRFGESFLKRMLNFFNQIYLNDIDAFGREGCSEIDDLRLILFYLFIQSLEKAYLLGLPKSYSSIKSRGYGMRGRLDIEEYLKRDIPFLGKISSASREMLEIQEIIDVLNGALLKIMRSPSGSDMTRNINHIKPHLRESASKKLVTKQTVSKAKKSRALLNPIFAPYKDVLRYAEYILNLDSLVISSDKNACHGFLINVADLFEVYVRKLLSRKFSDWNVSSPKIQLYQNQFYSRKIIPDIVMEKDNQIIVFDTKYKKMEFKGVNSPEKNARGYHDLDRSDFFQINTYMSYYNQQPGKTVVAGGLIYPLSASFDKQLCYSSTWLGGSGTRFIVDGIETSEDKDLTLDCIVAAENSFLNRIETIINFPI